MRKKTPLITKSRIYVFFQSSVYENVDGKYAAILSNPPIRAGKDIVHEILEKAVEYLVPGGELWIVIQKKQGAPSALKKTRRSIF